MEYMTSKQIAIKWGISERRVIALCKETRIDGAYLFGRIWAIPCNAVKPPDARVKTGKYIKDTRMDEIND